MTAHDCARIEELISAQMDGATTPEEDARIARHLGDCADCRTTALAFERVDREVGAYLRATPVPAIGTPWRDRQRPPLAIPGRVARWYPATLALTTILMLAVASVLTFTTFGGDRRQRQETSAPQSAYTTGGGAASSTAPSTAASAAPTATAAAAPAAAPALAPTAAARNATTNGRSPAASDGSTPAASTAPGAAPSSAPALGGALPTTFDPVESLRLDTATSVAVCQPDCASWPRGAATFERIIVALNAALPIADAPTMQGDTATALLRFTLADGTRTELRYLPPGADLADGRLQLPDGRFVIAPAALGEALAAP